MTADKMVWWTVYARDWFKSSLRLYLAGQTDYPQVSGQDGLVDRIHQTDSSLRSYYTELDKLTISKSADEMVWLTICARDRFKYLLRLHLAGQTDYLQVSGWDGLVDTMHQRLTQVFAQITPTCTDPSQHYLLRTTSPYSYFGPQLQLPEIKEEIPCPKWLYDCISMIWIGNCRYLWLEALSSLVLCIIMITQGLVTYVSG